MGIRNFVSKAGLGLLIGVLPLIGNRLSAQVQIRDKPTFAISMDNQEKPKPSVLDNLVNREIFEDSLQKISVRRAESTFSPSQERVIYDLNGRDVGRYWEDRGKSFLQGIGERTFEDYIERQFDIKGLTGSILNALWGHEHGTIISISSQGVNGNVGDSYITDARTSNGNFNLKFRIRGAKAYILYGDVAQLRAGRKDVELTLRAPVGNRKEEISPVFSARYNYEGSEINIGAGTNIKINHHLDLSLFAGINKSNKEEFFQRKQSAWAPGGYFSLAYQF